MKVLITEELAAAGVEKLRAEHDVEIAIGLTHDELVDKIRDADALVVRSATQVTADVFGAAQHLQVVGRAGIGVDNIDLGAATAHGVLVVNAPESNVLSAAEHTIAILLAQARNIAAADASLRAGRWDRKLFQGVELYGKTLGILGLGRVGSLVAERAAGFGMHLIGYDPFVSQERARNLGVELVGAPEDIFSRSDFITIHLPRTPDTENLIDAAAIETMRDGARIVNVARGGIIDEQAVKEAIESGKLGGAAVDVFSQEPCTDSPLFSIEGTVATPHLGASTAEAQDRAGVTIAEQVLAALGGEFAIHAVNIDIGRDVSEAVRDHLGLCRELGRIFAAYAGGVSDRIELEIAGEVAGHDTKALGLSVLQGIFSKAVEVPVTLVNAPLIADERGVELVTTSSTRPRDYVNQIAVRGTVGGRTREIRGTLQGEAKEPRLVGIDDYLIEIAPAKYLSIISNDDRPGVIGAIGTLLGDAGINIANMALGRHVDEPLALWGIVTDQPIPNDVQDAVRSSGGILEAHFLEV